jgi:DNA repair protein RadC
MIYQMVSERHAPSYRIASPRDVFGALARYANARCERFIVLTLDAAHQLIASRIVSIGLVNRTVVHPREVFFTAIKDNAVAIIVAHNHPSGKLDPSPEDLEITRRLREAGETLGISLLDHVIFHKKSGFFSFVEHGLLEPPSES